ncbi:hypothetical protein B296_00005831 [Ensete ventricosum]|uniref:AP2/ERF domain-containing protein n=1 Tax=Ensete ventricosum TaxID=4639 RepID=A0A427B9Z6_ENSVE|nr:hypothetical protein B296_00005831 [Ensete ventricosum]
MAHERLEAKIEFDLNVVSPGQSSAWASNSSEASSNAAAEEEDLRSTSGAASLCFDNLRCPTEPDAVDDDGEDEGGVLPELRVVTRPLLPMAVVASTLQPPAAANSSSTVRRGDLDFVEGTVGCAAEAEARVLLHRQQQQQLEVVKKSRRGPRSRSSQYRGVTFYRRTGRWESHIWLADASDCGKQVYLGGFDTAHAAARAYDRAAIKFRGLDADINFDLNDYDEDLNQVILEIAAAFEDVDLSLRISQPNFHSTKSDGNSTGTNFSHGSYEVRETGNAQVNSLPPSAFLNLP